MADQPVIHTFISYPDVPQRSICLRKLSSLQTDPPSPEVAPASSVAKARRRQPTSFASCQHMKTSSHLQAAPTHADSVREHAASIYSEFCENRAGATPGIREVFPEEFAALNLVTTEPGIRVTSSVFKVTGGKGAVINVELGRFWRNLHTHVLHDPVACNSREPRSFWLLKEYPKPMWYT
jgi:hypothetical protein